MPATQEPNLGLNFGWDEQEGFAIQMDENLKTLGALLFLEVINELATPPGSPTDGDRYLIGDSATGEWATHDGKIARRHESGWEIYPPSQGWELINRNTGQRLKYDGSAWVPENNIASSGSNGDGDYVNYGDGRVECMHQLTLSYVDANTCEATWTLPTTHSEVPKVFCSLPNLLTESAAAGMLDFRSVQGHSATTSQVTVTLFTDGAFTAGDSITVDVKSAGKWF